MDKHIKEIQRIIGATPDGVAGADTVRRIRELLMRLDTLKAELAAARRMLDEAGLVEGPLQPRPIDTQQSP